jgi:hypothetical protein
VCHFKKVEPKCTVIACCLLASNITKMMLRRTTKGGQKDLSSQALLVKYNTGSISFCLSDDVGVREGRSLCLPLLLGNPKAHKKSARMRVMMLETFICLLTPSQEPDD